MTLLISLQQALEAFEEKILKRAREAELASRLLRRTSLLQGLCELEGLLNVWDWEQGFQWLG